MKIGTALQAALVLLTLLLPAGAGAAELCLENTGNSSVYYRLNYVQQESVYAVNGFLMDGNTPAKVSTKGTAFRQLDSSLVISLTTTYPNYYSHPQCTDILTFAPGKFLVATVEGTCFGSTTEFNKQYTATYVRVPCP